jgi:hypothetical protein
LLLEVSVESNGLPVWRYDRIGCVGNLKYIVC